MQENMGTPICLRLFPNFACFIFLWKNNISPSTANFALIFLCMQILNQCDKLENKAILLIHFSARYTAEVSYLCCNPI